MLKRIVGAGLVVAAVMPFAAMAQEATPEATPVELPAVDALAVTGDIIVAGSSTVFPLTEAVAGLFTDEVTAARSPLTASAPVAVLNVSARLPKPTSPMPAARLRMKKPPLVKPMAARRLSFAQALTLWQSW